MPSKSLIPLGPRKQKHVYDPFIQDRVDELAALGMSTRDIAKLAGVTAETIKRHYAAGAKIAAVRRRVTLRRVETRLAMDGNMAAMAKVDARLSATWLKPSESERIEPHEYIQRAIPMTLDGTISPQTLVAVSNAAMVASDARTAWERQNDPGKAPAPLTIMLAETGLDITGEVEQRQAKLAELTREREQRETEPAADPILGTP